MCSTVPIRRYSEKLRMMESLPISWELDMTPADDHSIANRQALRILSLSKQDLGILGGWVYHAKIQQNQLSTLFQREMSLS